MVLVPDHLDGHYGQVIRPSRRCGKFADVVHQVIHEGCGGKFTIAAERGHQASFPVFDAIQVARFRNAIGIQNQPIATA